MRIGAFNRISHFLDSNQFEGKLCCIEPLNETG